MKRGDRVRFISTDAAYFDDLGKEGVAVSVEPVGDGGRWVYVRLDDRAQPLIPASALRPAYDSSALIIDGHSRKLEVLP